MDDELVTINHRLTAKGVSAIPDIFTSPYYQDASGYSYEYRPMVLVSFAIEHEIFGDNAHISHFFNVLLYALCCLLLYKVLLLLFRNYSPVLSVAIALLFAAHPAHSEVVCSIKNRDEILGLLFAFLTLYTGLRSLEKSRAWLILPAAIFFAFALMSKVSVVSFAAIVPLALILFGNTDFFRLIGITLILIVPEYFLLNLSQGFERQIASIAIFVAVIVFYAMANSAVVLQYLKAFTINSFSSIFEPKELTTSGVTGYSIKESFTGIIPDRKYLTLYPILTALVLGGFYIYGILQGFSLLAFIPISILFVISIWGEERFSWWAILMIGICLTVSIATINFRITDETQYNRFDFFCTDFLCLFLAYQAYYGRKGLFIPSLLCLLVTNYINVTVTGKWDDLSAFLIILLNFKYFRLIVMLLLLLGNIFMIATEPDILICLNYVPSILMVLSIHFKRGRNLLVHSLALVILMSFHFNQAKYDNRVKVKESITTIAKLGNQINPQIISTNQNRPLLYMEDCVDWKTPVAVRAGTSLEILLHYLHKVVLPYPQAFYYGYKFIYPQKITETGPIISLLVHVLLLLLAFGLMRKYRLIAFGLLVYLISIAVFSNYSQFVPGMLADRFLLVPSLGWAMVLVGILQQVFKVKDNLQTAEFISMKAGIKYTFGGILLFYSVITFSRNLNWKDDLTLFRHDISYVDQSAQAHNLLGLHIMQHTEAETDPIRKTDLEKEALSHFKRSQEIYPTFFNVAYDIGRVYVTLNMADSAIAAFKYAVTLDSTFGDAYLTMGNLLIAQSRFSEAIPCYERVIKIIPLDYVGYQQLSYVYFRMNEFDKSIAVNQQAIQKIHDIGPLINLARTYLAKNQSDSAHVYLLKANEMTPNNAEIQQMLKQTSK